MKENPVNDTFFKFKLIYTTSYREKSLGGQFDDKLKFYFHAIQLCETEDKKINVLVKVTPLNLRHKFEPKTYIKKRFLKLSV